MFAQHFGRKWPTLSNLPTSLLVYFCVAPTPPLLAHRIASSPRTSKNSSLGAQFAVYWKMQEFHRKRSNVFRLYVYGTRLVTFVWKIVGSILRVILLAVLPRSDRADIDFVIGEIHFTVSSWNNGGLTCLLWTRARKRGIDLNSAFRLVTLERSPLSGGIFCTKIQDIDRQRWYTYTFGVRTKDNARTLVSKCNVPCVGRHVSTDNRQSLEGWVKIITIDERYPESLSTRSTS